MAEPLSKSQLDYLEVQIRNTRTALGHGSLDPSDVDALLATARAYLDRPDDLTLTRRLDNLRASMAQAKDMCRVAWPCRTLEVLRGVRELLSDPARWTKKAQARDKQGNALPFDHTDACSWCLVWSARKAANGVTFQADQATRVLRDLADTWLMNWNDEPERTHAEVIALLDRAIAVEEAKVQR